MDRHERVILNNMKVVAAQLACISDRPFSKVEATALLSIDKVTGNHRTVEEYANVFGWTEAQTQEFFDPVVWRRTATAPFTM